MMLQVVLWLIGLIMGAIIGAMIEGLLTHILERRGLYERLARKFVWPPYFRDSELFRSAVENGEDKFRLITGDASWMDRDWGSEVFQKLKENSGNTDIKVLITGDLNKSGIRDKITRLHNAGITVHVIDKIPLAHKLRAIYSLNSDAFACIRQDMPKIDGEYIVKKYKERDLIKLIEGYFTVTPIVKKIKKVNDVEKFILDNGKEV